MNTVVLIVAFFHLYFSAAFSQTPLSYNLLAKPLNLRSCNQDCPYGDPMAMGNRVPYPFGFSGDCEIQLNCTKKGEIMIGDYVVRDVTSENILVDFPANCSRKTDDLEILYGRNYGISGETGLLVTNCSISPNCAIPKPVIISHDNICDFDNKSVSCFTQQIANSTFLNLSNLRENKCEAVFSSVIADRHSDSGLVGGTVELGWWLEECVCGNLAKKVDVWIGNGNWGCRCLCDDGYFGDGFLAGEGCRRTKTNVLTPGDELNSLDSTSTILSASGLFTLGFFTISSTNLTYLGIWYTNEQESHKIWVSNRDMPFVGYGVLSMDVPGTLKVINGRDGTTFFNVSNNQVVGSGNNTRATLEDSGNFVVYDTNKDGNNRTIWQSFDHPTDTLVPGMKLKYDHTTKHNWKLTSWASNDAPASGAFTTRLEEYQNSLQLLIYRREELYWASGPWINGSFQFLRLSDHPYRLDLNSDPATGAVYLTLEAIGSFPASSTLLQLSREGHFTDKGGGILTPSFCYGYQNDDYQNGCVVSPLPYCRARIDSYEWESGYYISGPNTYDANSSISLGDCMERCWNDCTCTGCMTDINGTGCITWTNKPNGGDGSGRVYVLISSIPPKKRIWRWILVSTAILLTCAFTTFLCYVRIQRRLLKGKENKRRSDIIQQLTGSNSFNYGDELERGIQDAPDVKIFSLKAVLTATNNFSNDNKLGQGGYGPVYKGELSDGRKIAIKKLSNASGQGILEFKSELILISKLQHTNLVRLYGCCIHQEEMMLIYEFMPNKSLDFFLFDKNKKIDWRIRFKIIEGIAQGLLYLHKYSRMRVIHRDLKVSNVLLDKDMNPKIADFGMARIFQQDVSEETTKRVVGTYGYMAPEYTMHGIFSFKSDVFSFGVLVLEIVSGKKNSSFHSLLRYAWELWRRDATLELKDEALGESYDVKQILRAIHIGLLCVQENATNRATMSKVISMLNNEIADLPIPKQPAFFVHPDEFQPSRSTEHSSGSNIQGSVNGLTITTMEAR